MKRFALVGRDIEGSFSPAIHSYCFEVMGLDAGYGIIDIESKSINIDSGLFYDIDFLSESIHTQKKKLA